jgi:hypothetical protein
MSEQVFSRRIGNRLTFAVEFEVHDSPAPRLWNEWWGYLWLWVEGNVVGNPFELEMIMIALEPLSGIAYPMESETAKVLSTHTSEEVLEMVRWAVYGEDDPAMEKLVLHREKFLSFEIFGGSTGPFFDGWEAVLLKEGATERFIYRQRGRGVIEAVWPLGTFHDILSEARNEFERLGRSKIDRTQESPWIT